MKLGRLMRRTERRLETPQVRVARPDQSNTERGHALEGSLGTYVWAFEPVIKIAALAPEQLEKLQAVAEELGVILVAYKDL